MSTLKERLRGASRTDCKRLCHEAAAELDRLTARVAELEAMPCGEEKHLLHAYTWKRRDEWVLEITGTIGDITFSCRHIEPACVLPQDVSGLPSLYARIKELEEALTGIIDAANSFQDDEGYEVAAQIRIRARAILERKD